MGKPSEKLLQRPGEGSLAWIRAHYEEDSDMLPRVKTQNVFKIDVFPAP